MKNNPAISVIVPIYNQEKYVGKCIDSIIKQDFSDIEIILVNDGSKDGSLEKCKKYAKRDERVIIIDKPNEGVVKARRDGLLKAKGDYICFVDGDDYLPTDSLSIMYRIAVEHNVDMVSGNLDFVYDSFNLRKKSGESFDYAGRLLQKEEVLPLLLGVTYSGKCCWGMQMWAHLYRRSCVEKAMSEDGDTLFPPHRHLEDFSFNLSIAKYISSMWNIDDVVYHYRFGGESSGINYLVVESAGAYFEKRFERCLLNDCEKALPGLFFCYMNLFKRDLQRMVDNPSFSEENILNFIKNELSTRKIVLWAKNNMRKEDVKWDLNKAVMNCDIATIMTLIHSRKIGRKTMLINKLIAIYQKLDGMLSFLFY